MSSHGAVKGHLASGIIFGFILVAAVFGIFGFLSQNYTVYIPMLVIYAAWVVISQVFYGRGLDREAADSH